VVVFYGSKSNEEFEAIKKQIVKILLARCSQHFMIWNAK